MSAAVFTPGPWWTELDKVFVGTPPNYELVADADPDNRGGVDGAEPMLANARLIAAAPELYEALSRILSYPAGMNKALDDPAVFALAMDATTKARGEQQ